MLGGIVLDLVARLLREYFKNNIPTNNAQEITAKIKLFHFVMKHPNTRDIWDFCLGGFKGDFYRFYR
ncbi:hypothetical protein FOG23_05930 [Helicobacter pylori]|nr:hypothetical protein [Helicobacter pylori]WRA67646.1 hypothetical protein FOG23_05930 [Helicobacter pylori]